jgi:hypothetical protein
MFAHRDAYAESVSGKKLTANRGALIDPGWVADAEDLLELGKAVWEEAEWDEWRRYALALVDLRVVVLYPVPEEREERPIYLAANAHGLYVDVPLHWEAGHRALLESMRELVSAVRRETRQSPPRP